MEEVWKDIEGYEGYYQVSNLGRVRSLDRVVGHADGGYHMCKGRVLKPSGNRDTHRYQQVNLARGGRTTLVMVHRLVAIAFVPKPDGCNVVDHIDADMFNNRADNLRWCTQADNLRFCREQGRFRSPGFHSWGVESQRSFSQKHRKPIVRDDGKWYESASDAAIDLGVTYSAISHVLRGTARTCKGHTFTYAL